MQRGYFFTGFPGFISNALIKKIIETINGDGIIYTLVLPQMMEKAKMVSKEITSEYSLREDQFVLIEGDITKPQLNLSNQLLEMLASNVHYVYHLAALYDLAVPKNIAYTINVEGTINVNDWVKTLPNLERYTYFSTAYVVGFREGTLYEHELIRPHAFKNYYEETKFEAEILVDQLKSSVPITIIRPGIVKGHSETGETIKFDGPYFILNFLDRLKWIPFIPYLGKSKAVINLVPVDYIIEATTYLSLHKKGEGKTYHLTDPNPYQVSEVYEMMMEELLNKRPKGILPLSFAKIGLGLKPVRTYLGVEKEALDYFTWLGKFDCSETQADLQETNIRCPDFKEGIPAMVHFYLQHKNDPNFQLKIL